MPFSARLTAFDEHRGAVLDLTALDAAALDALHGYRQARRNGYAPTCRDCHAGVCLVRAGGIAYWRHLPGEGARCAVHDVSALHGESPEHLAAKTAIVRTMRARDWRALPEHRFAAGGEEVRADVYAERERAAEHQAPTLFEVQLAYQPRGVYAERTERARRVAGHRVVWITPHADALGSSLGMVTDPCARNVIGRMW